MTFAGRERTLPQGRTYMSAGGQTGASLQTRRRLRAAGPRLYVPALDCCDDGGGPEVPQQLDFDSPRVEL